jgi:predicted permease
VPRLKFDIFLPATLAPVVDAGSRELDDRSNRGYSVMGRLAERGGVAAAREETSAAMAELALRYPATNTGIGADVLAFWDSPRGPQRFMGLALLVLQGILLLMLLSVCSNTANLVLARATARRREVGVRLALGARPGRIVTLLMAENVLLGLGGALAGMLIAFWGTDALRAMPPLRVRGLPITFETHVDGGTLLFAMLAGVASGIVFGLPAALHMARLEPQAAFREGAAASARGGTRAAILAVQVTLATIVLIAGGLVWRSFLETRDQDPGFRRDGILLAAYDLSGRNVPAADRRAFAARVLDAVRAVPGVERAALASSVPLDIHGLPSRVFSVEGHARTDGGVDQALTNTVSPGYFAALDIPLVAGADFVDLSDRTAPAQAIVNETFVREYLGGAVAVGRRIEARGRAFVICGVARNSLYNAFGEPPLPIIYLSYRDNPLASVELHLRTQPHAETAVAAGVRAAIAGLDPELPVYDVRTMRDHVESNLLFRRIPARMFAVLGPLLLALAAIGTYGVVACLVSIRRSEIGVRLALGATAGRVARQFAAESLRVVAASAVVGTALAAVGVLDVLGGARADPVVFGAVPGLLIGTAAAASWIPARQASRLDPASVMKGE